MKKSKLFFALIIATITLFVSCNNENQDLQSYDVITKISPSKGGMINGIPKEKVVAETIIILSATPEKEYKFSEWKITGVDGIKAEDLKKSSLKFKMPEKNVTVEAIFIKKTKKDILSLFPDSIFKEFCQEKYDTNRDGILSEKELETVKMMVINKNIKFPSWKNITSLEGIEHFPSIALLIINECQLRTIDLNKNKNLKSVDCSKNKLTSIKVTQNRELTLLTCSKNNLTSLDITQNKKLDVLQCFENQLTFIDVSQNKELETLYCWKNQLKSIDISQNKKLKLLDCSDNELEFIDVTQNEKLKSFDCSKNKLIAINISKNKDLKSLNCSNNKELKTIDISDCKGLSNLDCSECARDLIIKVWKGFDTKNPKNNIKYLKKDDNTKFIEVE